MRFSLGASSVPPAARWLLVGLLGSLPAALAACGGAPGAEAAKSADSEASSSEGQENEERSREPGSRRKTDAEEVAESPSGPSCDDGTCSVCGAGICPAGWYCDEGAAGGAACSWLKECAAQPSCGCVTKVLGSSCKCREESGSLKVSCG